MQRDKKNRNGRLRLISMQKLGHAVTTNEIDVAQIEALWKTVGAI
jgi:3-dehydroquinate synthetase